MYPSFTFTIQFLSIDKTQPLTPFRPCLGINNASRIFNLISLDFIVDHAPGYGESPLIKLLIF